MYGDISVKEMKWKENEIVFYASQLK